MNQARIVDINRYYRTGGVDWNKLKAHFDAVIISAGVGMIANPLLREQVEGALANGVPYMTYHIPSPIYTMAEQVAFYLSQYGVRNSATCQDIEPPNKQTRCVNALEAYDYNILIRKATGKDPIQYSNKKNITEALKWPEWLPYFKWWIAQWPYDIWPFQFTDYPRFLSRYAGQLPSTVKGTSIEAHTIMWQISSNGNAQELCLQWRKMLF